LVQRRNAEGFPQAFAPGGKHNHRSNDQESPYRQENTGKGPVYETSKKQDAGKCQKHISDQTRILPDP
jgi:hypothetical protein